MNRAIEFHDSAVEAIRIEDGTAVIHFSSVYIHQSDGEPAIDQGTGWVREASLRIRSAQIRGELSEDLRQLSGDDVHNLAGGSLNVDGNTFELIPIPLNVTGETELALEFWGYEVAIHGTGAELTLLGEPTFVEEVRRSK